MEAYVMKRNFLISDKQDITRIGMECLIKKFFPDVLLNFAENKGELISLLKINTMSCIVLDYSCSFFKTMDEVLNVCARFPATNWLLFSDFLSLNFLNRLLLEDTVFSIVLKSSALEEIVSALGDTYKGKQYICTQVVDQISMCKGADNPEYNILTLTEIDILKEIASGKTTKEIASLRNLSYHTVITHRKNIFRKLDVNTIYEATRYAIRAGIVDPAEYYI